MSVRLFVPPPLCPEYARLLLRLADEDHAFWPGELLSVLDRDVVLGWPLRNCTTGTFSLRAKSSSDFANVLLIGCIKALEAN